MRYFYYFLDYKIIYKQFIRPILYFSSCNGFMRSFHNLQSYKLASSSHCPDKSQVLESVCGIGRYSTKYMISCYALCTINLCWMMNLVPWPAIILEDSN